MGTAACGGRGFKGRTRVSGERLIGAARCRQQHDQASYQPPPPPATVPLAPSASFNGICNRQQPPQTALATPSNRLPNRLQGPFPSNASLAHVPS